MTPEETLASIQQKILEVSDSLNTVQEEQYRLKKQLVDIAESVRKAKYQLSRLRVEEKIATNDVWKELKGR